MTEHNNGSPNHPDESEVSPELIGSFLSLARSLGKTPDEFGHELIRFAKDAPAQLSRELKGALECVERGNLQGVANCIEQARRCVWFMAVGTDDGPEVHRIFNEPSRSYPLP